MLDNFSDSYKIRCGYSILCNDGVEIMNLGGSHIPGKFLLIGRTGGRLPQNARGVIAS